MTNSRTERLPTIGDVARLAGVSPATVSRALNAPKLLDPVTLQRVQAAAEKLHYQPLGVARSLRRRRSMVVGTMIQSMENASYIAGMVEFAQARLAHEGYTMLLASTSLSDELAVRSCRAMINQGVDAIMSIASRAESEIFRLLKGFSVPHVEAWVHDAAIPSSGFDHAAHMLEIAAHLLQLGHRHFAVVIPFRKAMDQRRRRLHGLEQAFIAHGLPPEPALVIDDGGFGVGDGRRAMARVMEEAPQATAVICANDNLAAGAILECASRGLEVPRHVSVTGYNDLEISSAMQPSITTVHTPYEPVANAAVDYLLAVIEGKPAPLLGPEVARLLIRASTGPPRTG